MKTIYIYGLLIGGIIGFSACTDSFESFNTNSAGYTEKVQEYDFIKHGLQPGIIQQGIYFNYDWGSGKNWPFQVMQNLGSDMFSGYFHDFNGGFSANNSTYALNDGWTSSTWTNTYGYIMPAVKKSEDLTTAENNPPFLGITKILKVELMHRISDLYGPVVYTDFGSKTGSVPDNQKDAYYAFFKDLDDGMKLLKDYIQEFPGNEKFARFDILTKSKTYAEWLKFANSLRLRLAIRISNVDKVKAQTEVTKALNDDAGLLETRNEVIATSTESGYSNPLGTINKGWSEVFMNANMESILNGYADPRTTKFFDKAAGGVGTELAPIKGTYKGIRQGTGFGHNNYIAHSKSTVGEKTDAILMTSAEVWFLRAEAALRGLSTETVSYCYRMGVETSFEQWEAKGVQAYLESEAKPADYIDAFDKSYNGKAASTITPKWNEEAPMEEKLERIITQKWIACYPEGCEPWAEQRRTGYPKLLQVLKNNSGGAISTTDMIRRMPFPQDLKSSNPTQYGQLSSALGGADTGGTRLWWDAGKNNF